MHSFVIPVFFCAMSKGVKQGLILFMILVFPSLFYVILSGSNHDIVGLPYYAPTGVNDDGDTIFHRVEVINNSEVLGSSPTLGKQFKENTVKIVSLIDFTPESFRVMEQMQNLHDRFNDKPDVLLISVFSRQPSDSALAELKRTYSVSSDTWLAVLSNDDAVAGLKINEQSKVEQNPLYVITLLDQENHIRGYFDGIQYVDTKEVREAVKALRFKNYRPVKDTNQDERK